MLYDFAYMWNLKQKPNTRNKLTENELVVVGSQMAQVKGKKNYKISKLQG